MIEAGCGENNFLATVAHDLHAGHASAHLADTGQRNGAFSGLMKGMVIQPLRRSPLILMPAARLRKYWTFIFQILPQFLGL